MRGIAYFFILRLLSTLPELIHGSPGKPINKGTDCILQQPVSDVGGEYLLRQPSPIRLQRIQVKRHRSPSQQPSATSEQFSVFPQSPFPHSEKEHPLNQSSPIQVEHSGPSQQLPATSAHLPAENMVTSLPQLSSTSFQSSQKLSTSSIGKASGTSIPVKTGTKRRLKRLMDSKNVNRTKIEEVKSGFRKKLLDTMLISSKNLFESMTSEVAKSVENTADSVANQLGDRMEGVADRLVAAIDRMSSKLEAGLEKIADVGGKIGEGIERLEGAISNLPLCVL